jgi:organic radical activating enzyme
MKKVIKIKRETDGLYIYWVLTNACNYDCGYCPEYLKSGQITDPKNPTNEHINQFMDQLLDKHLQGRFLSVLLTGGEPTLHPMFKTIVERLGPAGYVETITNGSQTVEWWQDMTVLPNKVTISLHPGTSDLQEINKIGLYLLDKRVKLNFNLMCDPTNWDWLDNVKTTLDKKLQVFVNAKLLVEHSEKVSYGKLFDYEPTQLDYIKTNQSKMPTNDIRNKVNVFYDNGTKDIISRDITSMILTNKDTKPVFTGWSCSAGKDGYMVDYNGIIKAGICGSGILGKLENFKPFESDIICVKKSCNFPKDLGLNKQAPILLQGQ